MRFTIEASQAEGSLPDELFGIMRANIKSQRKKS